VKLKKKQVALVGQLQDHFAAQAFGGTRPSKSRAAASAAVANLVQNKTALQGLHSGFGVNAQVRFFKAGDSLPNVTNIPRLSVRFLGPPTDEKFLAKMDPPSGHSYLRLDGNRIERVNQLNPFAEKWDIKPNDPGMKNLRLTEKEKKRLQDEVAGDSL